MTKKQYKNRIMRLESRIGEMQEQVVHCRRQAKLLDAEDSKRLLEKYHIESEELAELIYRHQQETKAKAAENTSRVSKPSAPEPDAEGDSEPVKEAMPKPEPPVNRATKTAPTAPAAATDAERISKSTKQASVPEPTGQTPIPEPQPEHKAPMNPLDMFK